GASRASTPSSAGRPGGRAAEADPPFSGEPQALRLQALRSAAPTSISWQKTTPRAHVTVALLAAGPVLIYAPDVRIVGEGRSATAEAAMWLSLVRVRPWAGALRDPARRSA